MAIKMAREPSETPNINNIDDIVPMRYAYGNQNGYVIGKGTEISNTVNGLNFTVNSGRLVLQGVECDIDATGVTITIDNIATKRYYTVYLEVNLGLNTATIKDEYDTATYPTIDVGDDLTENSTGVARLPLYQFTATNGVIGEVNKVIESVKYAKEIKVDNSSRVNNLEIKKDENGIIRVGDFIIPQKKVLLNQQIKVSMNLANVASSYIGYYSDSSILNLFENNKIYEIHFSLNDYHYFVKTKCIMSSFGEQIAIQTIVDNKIVSIALYNSAPTGTNGLYIACSINSTEKQQDIYFYSISEIIEDD